MTQMNSLSRVFTRRMLRCFIDGKKNKLYSSMVKRFAIDGVKKNNKQLISELYCELKKIIEMSTITRIRYLINCCWGYIV